MKLIFATIAVFIVFVTVIYSNTFLDVRSQLGSIFFILTCIGAYAAYKDFNDRDNNKNLGFGG